MRNTGAGLAAFGAFLTLAPASYAGVSEVHIGAMRHNICVTDCKNANKEDGLNVEFEVSFDSPDFLTWAGAPRPYLVASLNSAGDTSFAGGGVEWRFDFAEGWALEPGIGYVVHDGELDNLFDGRTPEAAAFAEEHVLLGSRDLFRSSLGLTRDFEGPWEAQLFFSHLSHGQILGNGRNQGMDQLGFRMGYQFGG